MSMLGLGYGDVRFLGKLKKNFGGTIQGIIWRNKRGGGTLSTKLLSLPLHHLLSVAGAMAV